MRPPVLLIAFRRPDLTARVVAAIREQRPTRLYAAVDGPREGQPGEAELVAATVRAIRDSVDWDCTLELRVRPTNLGCRFGVADAISWFFEHEPEGIILEDDCVPHDDFFRYCEEMLERYRDDQRVFAICGDNSSAIELSGPWSYGFIRYPNVWGWASWRRAWTHYDDALRLWQEVRRDEAALALVFPDPRERAGMTELLDTLVATGRPDTWDYRWSAACLLNTGLCAIPRVSLVENIGFRPDATHTRTDGHVQAAVGGASFPLVHPPLAVLDRAAERQVFLRGADLLSGRSRILALATTALGMLLRPQRWGELVRVTTDRLRSRRSRS